MSALLLTLAALVIGTTGPELRVVKNADLLGAIKAQRGKVTAVYFWCNYSIPDKHLLNRVISLHHRYARDGLVILAVSLDASEDAPAVRKYLFRRQVPLTNFLLDETSEGWDENWKLMPPALVVFGCDGKEAARFVTGDETFGVREFPAIEARLRKLLAER